MEQATYTSWPRCGVLLLAHYHRKPHMHPLCSLGPGPPPFHLVLETGYVSVASFAIHMHLRLTGLVCPGIRWVPAPRPFTWVPAPRPFHLVLETGDWICIRRLLCDPYALAPSLARTFNVLALFGSRAPALPPCTGNRISPLLRGLQDQCSLIRMQQFAFVAPLAYPHFHVLKAGRREVALGS
jgi:hypothetical protein